MNGLSQWGHTEPAAPSLLPRFSAHLVPLTARTVGSWHTTAPDSEYAHQKKKKEERKYAPSAAYVRIF